MKRRLQLVPSNLRLGWTPYAWLFYLVSFLAEPVLRFRFGNLDADYALLTTAGLVVFLVSYFTGYWVHGRRLLAVVLVQAALGVAFTPINYGAAVFFVYAGSFAARLRGRGTGLRTLLLVALVATITGALTGAVWYYWLVALPVTLLVGGVNLHYAQVDQAQRKLRLAHEEIEHLAAVAERERIARDLHDVLGHTLSLIVLKAELAGKLATTDPARAAAEIRDVEAVARRTLREVREAIKGYHPTLAEEADRARAMLKAAGIEGTFRLEPPPLPSTFEETLAMALREGITNVVRHADATACSVTLAAHGTTVALDIRDDGRGGAVPEGSGLRAMRERIEALGGRVARAGGRGMRLRIELPLAPGPVALPDRVVPA